MASDGVLEINQACAVNTGCFSGDTAGYPVKITGAAGHSYRLTSDLNVDQSTNAILVQQANNVSIDLNGFSIVGPVTCSGTPVACTPTGVGHGVSSVGDPAVRGVSVKNGSITGMGWYGVILADQSEITNLRVSNNRGHGIVVNFGSLVSGNNAELNGDGGIYAGDGSTVSGNVVYKNGGNGISTSAGSTISGNVAYENDDDGIICQGACTVSANTSYKNSGTGINSAHGSTISGNTSYNNGGDGFLVYRGSTVSGNTARSNTGYGLSFQGTDSAIAHNVISNNAAGTILGPAIEIGPNACNASLTCP